MTILEKIVAYKREEVARNKELVSIETLEQSLYFALPCLSLKHFLQHPEKSGIIAEFKRKSPSKGDINTHSTVEEVTMGYSQAGASGLSVLTDEHFFGGSDENLKRARRVNFTPILRKEFIIDEYQLFEAKSIGADVVLLIAECLSAARVEALARQAKQLGLEVLMEIHSEEELSKCNEYIDVVGVNNRNLKNFTVSIETSIRLFDKISDEYVKISESGISNPDTIIQLKKVGFQGFLIGEHFMKQEFPDQACAAFIQQVRQGLV